MRIEDHNKRQFYEVESRQGNWSVRQLDRQIQSLLYERTSLSRSKQAVIARAHHQNQIERPEDAIKEPYILDFLNLRDDYSESDLEDALISHVVQPTLVRSIIHVGKLRQNEQLHVLVSGLVY